VLAHLLAVDAGKGRRPIRGGRAGRAAGRRDCVEAACAADQSRAAWRAGLGMVAKEDNTAWLGLQLENRCSETSAAYGTCNPPASPSRRW
jgi:hypothetical protein